MARSSIDNPPPGANPDRCLDAVVADRSWSTWLRFQTGQLLRYASKLAVTVAVGDQLGQLLRLVGG